MRGDECSEIPGRSDFRTSCKKGLDNVKAKNETGDAMREKNVERTLRKTTVIYRLFAIKGTRSKAVKQAK